jgi:endonuclease/exonuclease/phosphatase family metal-dependent hydrolase
MSDVRRDDIWRVATVNIWNRSGPWPRRRELLRAEIAALDLDALGLQEVLQLGALPSQAHELVPDGWHVFVAPAWRVGGELSLCNAIASPHALADSRALALPSPPGLDTRSIAFARVAAPHGPLPFFVTHLTVQAHLSPARRAQARALADHVAALAPIDEPPPVVVGDMNAEPDADEMRFLRGLTSIDGASVYFADAWLASGAAGTGFTWDRANPYARATREPSRRIDYIFARGPDRFLRGEPLSARLCFDRPGDDGAWPTDHFGVVAEIAAAKRAPERY